jgi:hypothetical protein
MFFGIPFSPAGMGTGLRETLAIRHPSHIPIIPFLRTWRPGPRF